MSEGFGTGPRRLFPPHDLPWETRLPEARHPFAEIGAVYLIGAESIILIKKALRRFCLLGWNAYL